MGKGEATRTQSYKGALKSHGDASGGGERLRNQRTGSFRNGLDRLTTYKYNRKMVRLQQNTSTKGFRSQKVS